MIKLKGEVEIIGKENNKITYYDKGENLVTYWARHAVMHLLTGDVFGNGGNKRLSATVSPHTNIKNPDGTLLSKQQYFYNNDGQNYDEDFYWSKSTREGTFPFMPVKMLLGTGVECKTYTEIGTYSGVDEWGSEPVFNDGFSSGTIIDNNYSNTFDESGAIIPTRSVNSALAEPKTTPSITQKDFGISGAVKNGGYENKSEYDTKTVGNNTYGRMLKPELRGIGEPCFIYSLRGTNTFEKDSSEVMLTKETVTAGENIESKITFTVVMPEQTGVNSTAFYPYNGYTIKEIGLFTDAGLYLDNNSSPIDGRMPYGMLFAKRYVAPFTKTANSSFTIRWTIYI